jgi:flagellar basal-body rod protein FlgB
MSMSNVTNNLFSDPTMQGLQFALNSLSQRQQVLSNNIANAQTPGFVAQDVSFEDQLSSILGGSASGSASGQGTVVNAADLTSSQDGNRVDLESQMSKVTETNIMYDALAQLTADRLGILNTAITG